MNTDTRTQPKVLAVLDAVVGEEDGQPVIKRKPVFISLWLAMSKWVPVSPKWVEEN